MQHIWKKREERYSMENKHRWENSIRIVVGWICLVHDWDQWHPFMPVVIDLCVQLNVEDSMTIWTPFSFSKRDFAVWSWLIWTIWIIKYPVIVKVKFQGMYILTIQINQQDATVSQVYYLTFMCGSTCFGRLFAHHQEHTTALGFSDFTVGEWWLECFWSWSARPYQQCSNRHSPMVKPEAPSAVAHS
jgi:hypothetical protein